jgi:hypothetical protein
MILATLVTLKTSSVAVLMIATSASYLVMEAVVTTKSMVEMTEI